MKLNDLTPAAYNPRKISDEQLQRLKKSLAEFGDLSGIVFNRRTGNIVGGHQRLKCLPPDAKIEKKDLKEKSKTGTVSQGFIILEGEKYTYREVNWDEATEKTANIAANKQGGEWDDDKLASLLQELSNMPIFDSDLIGFDTKEIDELISQITGEGQIDDDEIPEVDGETITKTGDLYILGNHRLLCGDATKKEDVERLMGGKKADMVFTDPPYGINIVKGNKLGGKGTIGSSNKNKIGRMRQPGGKSKGTVGGKGIIKPRLYRHIINDDKPFDPSFLMELAPTIILWGGNCYASRLPNSNGWLVWDKGTSPNTTFSACELAYTNKGNHIKKYEHRWSGMCRAGGRKEELQDRVHPTQKPVGLITQILIDYEGSLVLDLFLGSGSTLIACEKTNRICYGMEIDPYYCDVIVTRYHKYTGINKIIRNGEKIEWTS